MNRQTLWPIQSIGGADIGQTDSLFKASIYNKYIIKKYIKKSETLKHTL